MATLVFAAAGAAAGSAIGGTVAGISAAVIGQAVGATIGSMVDQRLLSTLGGSTRVNTGQLSSARLSGAREGAALPYVAGRVRVAGQMIWSTRFLEEVSTHKTGGKGLTPKPKVETTTYSYSVSFALSLCEGEVRRIGRVWADGAQINLNDYAWRLYPGDDTQMPDPLIEAVEGAGRVPAYRGTAYIVFEGFPLGTFGNRIPQIQVEVFRRPVSQMPETDEIFDTSPVDEIRAVALMPGTGEYALADTVVRTNRGIDEDDNVITGPVINVNNRLGVPDVDVALDALDGELPACNAASLIVSWFGDDLRADRCELRPKVEQGTVDGYPMPWTAGGIGRDAASWVSRTDGRVNFGGTPADRSVIDAIRNLSARGKAVTFYPFVLMDIPGGSGLSDPWSDGEQGAFPWRGRITTSIAPGRSGTPDLTATAAAEVAAFVGEARPWHFDWVDGAMAYSGPFEWSLRRFILHYARLCAVAGGVDAFCIGSEFRGLTHIRDGVGSYPFVAALQSIAADVRSILPGAKIGYAADWSEYFGHHPQDGSGDVFYHLDPLWADANIDFIGIDNYMPLSDWRDGPDHADAEAGAIYDLDYLRSNVSGGEGYDWYYASAADRDAQVRSPITDGAYGDPHVFRYKDLLNWWQRPHFNRPGGVRELAQTDWLPEMKPIWFTELGCPAVDKGTNQPNLFIDPKSAESALPYFSTGARDDFIQYQYLKAMFSYWGDPGHNPVSEVYGGPMVDMDRAHVWAWDARPWPDFPNRTSAWSDGPNHARGHWVSGRTEDAPLAHVIAELCGRSGVGAVDVSRVHGMVSGFEIGRATHVREALEPLMLAYAVDAFEQDGLIIFRNRDGFESVDLSDAPLVVSGDGETALSLVRAPESERTDRVRVVFPRADDDYQTGAVEVQRPGSADPSVVETSLPLVITGAKAREVADRWLSESELSLDAISLSVPPSAQEIVAGDVLTYDGKRYQIDRIEDADGRVIEARRVDAGLYVPPYYREETVSPAEVALPGPLQVQFLDLPLLRGDEVAHAPYIAASATPWTGQAAVGLSLSDDSYALNTLVPLSATTGLTQTALAATRPGLWDRGPGVEIALESGALESREPGDVLNGANVAALKSASGDWEIIQFQTAELIAPDVYRISGLLRGQAGTEWLIPESWPAGTRFVLLNAALAQADLPLSARGLDRYYRIGPATKPFTDESYRTYRRAFDGVGLRPYAPCHLEHRWVGGDLALRWIRRTRIDGDHWGSGDVPLSEEMERYMVRAGSFEVEVSTSEAVLPAAALPALPFTVSVAQVSARWGAGPAMERTLNV
ncbi:MAG: glycoside hydrolase/phage tail family protein [Pseudomonadota bacterium]